MKKLAYTIALVLAASTLAACMAEEKPSAPAAEQRKTDDAKQF